MEGWETEEIMRRIEFIWIRYFRGIAVADSIDREGGIK